MTYPCFPLSVFTVKNRGRGASYGRWWQFLMSSLTVFVVLYFYDYVIILRCIFTHQVLKFVQSWVDEREDLLGTGGSGTVDTRRGGTEIVGTEGTEGVELDLGMLPTPWELYRTHEPDSASESCWSSRGDSSSQSLRWGQCEQSPYLWFSCH